jgi:uncharacterized radical SAM superfamily protein
MNEDFIFRLGADVSSFTKSITEVEKELDSARKAIKGALGDDLVKGNQYVQDLEQSLKNLRSVGVQVPGAAKAANEIKNIAPAAQKAQNTLTGLSGVVRDLPFGFIAIQNNLPILADQFSSLSKTSGGVGGALKNLGGALIGPAGVAFAFGAVTSIVTGLIQEYGSLSEALNVILGITKPLTEAQKAYNKASFETAGNVAAEESKVNILTKTLLDNKKPQADRLAAYGELKKVAPDVVSGIKDENALTNESNLLIAANSKLRAESVRLKVQEAGITAALTTNETKIAELRAKLATATDKYVKSAEALNKSDKQAIITGLGSVSAQQLALDAFNDNAKAVKELNGQIAVLTGENQKYLNQLDPVVIGLANINEQTRKQVEGLKESNKETKASETNSKKRTKQLEREAIAIAKKSKADEKALEKLREERTIRVTAQLEVDFQRRGNIDTSEILKKRIKETQKEVERTAGVIQVPLQFPAVNPLGLLQNIKLAQAEFQKLKEAANLEATTQLLSDTFFSPINELFNNLISGAKNSMQEFGKAITSALKQLVAKIIATGIIQIIGVLLSGGFSAGAGGAANGFKQVLKGIGSAFGFKFEANTFKNAFDFAGIANGLQNAINSVNTSLAFQGSLAGVANPNFGGVTGGGMAMSGAVNVVLRGQDLVGSLNRTNAQINRVG